MSIAISQYGITWYISGNSLITGQYCNGDYWVVGPAIITGITPMSTSGVGQSSISGLGRVMHGSMVNPSSYSLTIKAQGFDSDMFTPNNFYAYTATLNVARPGNNDLSESNPLILPGGASLVSSISVSGAGQRPQVNDAAILTVVNLAPPSGAFRPPPYGPYITPETGYHLPNYTGNWNKTGLNYGIFQSLTPIGNVPSLTGLIAGTQRPWLEYNPCSFYQYTQPVHNGPNYGQFIGQTIADTVLSLHLNYTNAQKEQLFINLVQYGLDVYGAGAHSSGFWYADGGLLNGRKLPMLIAGLALNDTGILAYADPTKQPNWFSEDGQTFYVQQSDVGRPLLTGDITPARLRSEYVQADVGVADYGEQHFFSPNRDGRNWNSMVYRDINGSTHGPNALAARLLTGGLGVSAWNHQEFFDYADRYMRAPITGNNPVQPWHMAMWTAYRGYYPDPDSTNYKCGIDVIWSGIKDIDYVEEYYYHDKKVTDRKTIYLKTGVPIVLNNNFRNLAFINGNLITIGTGGDEVGLRRYRIDRDLQYQYDFANGPARGNLNLPAYTGAFTFDTLFFESGVKVVGSTGTTGGALTVATSQNYYWRGMQDSVGDEWHTFTIGHDDSSVSGVSSDTEQQSTDGKIFYIVINPKAPTMSVRPYNGAQFYTTPPKKYFIPVIYDQTTYVIPGTGSVLFELKDLYNNQTQYRLNSGIWSGDAIPQIFFNSGMPDGNYLLEYFSNANSIIKSRTIVKNPSFPSSGENHGSILVGQKGLSGALASMLTSGWVKDWYTLFNNNGNSFNHRTDLVNNLYSGNRYGFAEGGAIGVAGGGLASTHSMVALRNGWEAKGSGPSQSYGWFVKGQLIDNPTSIDSIGLEKQRSFTSLPAREVIYRGYYDIIPILDMALAYDLAIGNYRSDQFTSGITPVEDYYIRDCLARSVQHGIFYMNMGNQLIDPPGMWDTARMCAAVVCALVMPSYSTPIFGTCGLDGNTGTYPWTPFPSGQYTWKKILLDNDGAINAFPNWNRNFGIEEYDCTSSGTWHDKVGYFQYGNMGRPMSHAVNAIKIAAPAYGTRFPHYELALHNNAVNGITGGIADNGGFVSQYNIPTTINTRFPASAQAAHDWVKAITNNTGDPNYTQRMDALAQYTQGFGMLWMDDPLIFSSGVQGYRRLGRYPKFAVFSNF